MTNLKCPHCGRDGTTAKDLPFGSSVRCPGCKEAFKVPTPMDLGIVLDGDEPSPPADDAKTAPSPQPPTVPVQSSPSPVAQPASTPITPPNPSRRAQSHSPNGAGCVKLAILYGFATIFFLAGLVAFMDARPSDSYSIRERFQEDNAYGATANASERIARRMGQPRPEGWIIAGLLCCLIVSVDNLRGTTGVG